MDTTNSSLNIIQLIREGDYENFGEDYLEQMENLDSLIEWVENLRINYSNNEYNSHAENLLNHLFQMKEDAYHAYRRRNRARQRNDAGNGNNNNNNNNNNNYRITELTGGVLIDERDCGICLERLDSNVNLVWIDKCRHIFHKDCILRWARNSRTCPTCRSSFFGN